MYGRSAKALVYTTTRATHLRFYMDKKIKSDGIHLSSASTSSSSATNPEEEKKGGSLHGP